MPDLPFPLPPLPSPLALLRWRIDAADRALVRLLARRRRLTDAAALCKRGWADPADPRREGRVLANVRREAARLGLDPATVEPVWALLLRRSLERQRRMLRPRGAGAAAHEMKEATP
ncbi:MAG: chorismate mutase [Maricaulaceae bacterium]|nr:chorismate mutase [Maricaulaceae bacterium]